MKTTGFSISSKFYLQGDLEETCLRFESLEQYASYIPGQGGKYDACEESIVAGFLLCKWTSFSQKNSSILAECSDYTKGFKIIE